MKIPALALTVALLVHGATFADASAPSQLALAVPTTSASERATIPALSLTPIAGADALGSSLTASSGSHFAQFDTRSKSVPVSPAMVFAMIALFILGMRLMGVRQAHAMAEHERHSHHGRSQMFRSLHEERSSQD